MALAIVTTNDLSHCYSPGELISGVVRLTTTWAEEPSESLSISFVGHAQTQMIRNNTDMVNPLSVHKTSCAYLFRQCLMLDRASKLHGPGMLVWPFIFEIPRHPTFQRKSKDVVEDGWFDCTSPWKGSIDAESHLLPPSFNWDSNFKCSIEYSLTARLIRPPHVNLERRQNVTASAAIIIRPPMDISAEENLSRILYCNFAISHKTKLEALKWRARQLNLGSSPTSRHLCCQDGDLFLRVRVPRRIDVRKRHRIALSACVLSSGCEHVEQIKIVDVKWFALDLIVITKVRVGAHKDMQRKTINLCKGSFTLPLLHKPPHGQELNVAEDEYSKLTDLGLMARERFRVGSWTPEFATYNIFRAYSLRLRTTISFASKARSFDQDNIPIEVVHGSSEALVDFNGGNTQILSSRTMVETQSSDLDGQTSLLLSRATHDIPPPLYTP